MNSAPYGADSRGWLRSLHTRVATLWWLKALGNTVFLVVFFQLYLWLQKNPLFAVTQIPATALDDWIGFQPWTITLYLSLWVYTALPVALQPDKPRLMRYAGTISVLCLVALLVFLVWPTSVSDAVGVRPASNGLFAMLYAVDSTGNACPSLHVAASVMSCMWLQALGNTVLLVVFFQLYLWLQKKTLFAVTQIPAPALDDGVCF